MPGRAGHKGQPPVDHVLVQTTEPKAAAAVRISTQLALRKRAELLEGLRPCSARTEPWLQAGKYLRAVMRELPELNGWSIARDAGDRRPDKTQRLLNHASWDTFAAMGVVRRFAVAGLAEAARKGRRRRGHLVIGAVDETGQEKAGTATAGVKRQYLGCAGKVANGINTVHLAYVREKTGHALIGARQQIPAEQVRDPAKALATGLPPGLAFRTKGQLAIDLCAEAYAGGLAFDFVCGDEVYGSSTELRQFLESRGQAYVLRVASNLILTLAGGAKITCAQAVKRLARDRRRWEVRSAGQGSKGERWYAPGLDRRRLPPAPPAGPPPPAHRRTGLPLLLRARGPGPHQSPADQGGRPEVAGRRRTFKFGKDTFGLDHCQARLYAAITRHLVLVMAALAVCAVTAALLKDRTDTQAPPPASPDQAPPADPGLIPLSVPEIKRLLAAIDTRTRPPGHVIHWDTWTRRHQARARWFHKRARLKRDYALVS